MSALIEHLREVTPKQWFWLILLCAVAGYLAGKLVGHFFRTTAPAALELSKTLVGAAAGVAAANQLLEAAKPPPKRPIPQESG